MTTKFDFTKAWNELSDEEQTAWDTRCQKSKIRQIKDFAKVHGLDFKKLGHLCVVDSVSEWDERHIKKLRDNCAEKYKPLLKSAENVKEYDRIFMECAKEMEAIGL